MPRPPPHACPAPRARAATLRPGTFASPVNLRPIELGFDVVVHSATKFLNGHSDAIAGVVCGRKAMVEGVRSLANVLG